MPNSMTHRLLVVDDNEAIHSDYHKILGQQKIAIPSLENFDLSAGKNTSIVKYQIDDAYQGEEAVQLVEHAQASGLPYSLAYVDLRMPPGQNGLVTIEQMWEICPDLQVVICTANSDSTWREINDYLGYTENLLILKKPFEALELLQLTATLTRKFESGYQAKVKQNRLESLLRERTQELEHAAEHDQLTGLPNRKKFNRCMEELIRRSEQYGTGVALLHFDLDQFGPINDIFGHDAGDHVLGAISQRLVTMMLNNELEIASRLDGDEFALLLSGFHDAKEVSHIAEAILTRLSLPIQVADRSMSINISMGVAFAGRDGRSGPELLKHSGLALKQAKRVGGSRAVVFNSEMERDMFAKQNLERRLYEAVENEQLTLFFQPIYGKDRLELVGAESLLRWVDGNRIITPGDIIPLAEKNGLIIPIGEFVIEEACRQAASWRTPIRVAVNVSPLQFEYGELGKKIQQAISRYQLDPRRLEVEITESSLLNNSDGTARQLREIQEAGVRIVLDDFGTGFASLSYLQKFSFDKLKLDQCFVRNLDRPDVKAIVSSVSLLAQSLEMEMTAEGVETIEQLEFVLGLGIDQIQGFLLSKPKPTENLFPRVDRNLVHMAETIANMTKNPAGLENPILTSSPINSSPTSPNHLLDNTLLVSLE